MAMRTRFLTTSAFGTVLALSVSGAFAEDAGLPVSGLPAVSGVNGKLGVFGGDDATLGATGSLAIPLGDQWGAQVDGMFGSAAAAAFHGYGVHAFWRDPAKGLIGVTASTVTWDQAYTNTLPERPRDFVGQIQAVTGATVTRFGVEGEAYLGRVSLEGALTFQSGTHTGVGGRAAVAFYPTDDLRLDVGAAQTAGVGTSFRVGGEWAPAKGNFTLFANAALSDGWSALGGARFYFGQADKSLIRRHREDDPAGLLPEDLYTVVGDAHCPIGTAGFRGFCDGNL